MRFLHNPCQHVPLRPCHSSVPAESIYVFFVHVLRVVLHLARSRAFSASLDPYLDTYPYLRFRLSVQWFRDTFPFNTNLAGYTAADATKIEMGYSYT